MSAESDPTASKGGTGSSGPAPQGTTKVNLRSAEDRAARLHRAAGLNSPSAANTPPQGANPDAPVDYVFGSEIARGGMGSILQAEDCKLPRTVAVKIILSEIDADEDQKQRFINEAAVLAKLAHPNIVPVYDIGRDADGQLYYSMKLVKGRTLQAIIHDIRNGAESGRGILPVPSSETGGKMALPHYTLDRLLTIFRKVCDAMAFAHSKGIIHRDLKPENVMVGEFGEVLVMDWGLAKLLGSKDEGGCEAAKRTMKDEAASSEFSSFSLPASSFSATLQGSVMGTPQYMSPEQAEGRIADMDARSDIFSLGGILYCILTLRPPVEGKTLDEVLQKVISGSITPPSAFGASSGNGQPAAKGEVLEARKIKPLPHCPGGRVPSALSAVAMKALSLKREARYPTTAEFSADIEAYQNGFATRAEQANLMKQIMLLIQRHKGVFATTLAALLVLAAMAAWFIISITASERETSRQAEIATHNAELAAQNAREARQNEQAAKAAEAQAVLEKEATRRALAKSHIALAESAYRDHDSLAMQKALKDVPDDLRDSNWSYLLEHSDNSVATIRTRTNSPILEVAAHPKKPSLFAIVGSDGWVALVEGLTGVRPLEFRVGPKEVTRGGYRLAISPDGGKLAIGKNLEGGVAIHSTTDGSKLTEWPSAPSDRLQFSPDGTQLLQISRSTNAVNLLDATSGSPVWTFKSEGPRSQTRAVFAPDGQTVLTFFTRERLRLLSAKDGSLVRSYDMTVSGDGGVAFSPDGGRVLVASLSDARSVVRCLYNKDDGRLIYQFHAEDARLTDFAYDGSRIVTLAILPGGRQSIKVWDGGTGALLQTLMGGSEAGDQTWLRHQIAVHPLSGEIVVAGPTTKAWNLSAPQERWKIAANSSSLQGAFWGTDDLLLTSRSQLNAAVLDLRTAAPLKQLYWELSLKNHTTTPFSTVTVSADGRYAAIGMSLPRGSGKENAVQLLCMNENKVEMVNSFSTKVRVDKIRLSPDGALIWIYSKLLDPATGRETATLEMKDAASFKASAWLSSARLVTAVSTKGRGVSGSREQLVLWEAATGRRLQTVDNPSAILCLASVPGASLFAEAGTDRMVRLRDANTLEVKREFRAHDAAITALAFHPSRPILATASDDLTIKLWNTETGRNLEELRGPIGSTRVLSISPGGKRLACWADKTTRIWEPKSFNENPAVKAVADGWENLLGQLDPASVAETGNGWQLNNDVLTSPARSRAVIALPGTFGQTSYQVRVKLRALDLDQVFHVCLPVAGEQSLLMLDAKTINGDFFTCLNTINGSSGFGQPGTAMGQVLKDSELHELEITVRLDGADARIEARFDEQALYMWSGPVSALSESKNWGPIPKDALAFVTHKPSWVVYAVKAKRLDK